jgi:hypothetical protein
MMGFSMRRFVQAFQMLLPLMFASCGVESPTDLRLKQIYVADRTAIPVYWTGALKGLVRPVALIIELTTSDTFPNGAYVSDGFCGEKIGVAQLGDGGLYRATDSDDGPDSEETAHERAHQRRYLAIVEIVPNRLSERPRFDLENDNRDICVLTSVPTMFAPSQMSNEVRVPRSLIDKALHEPVRASIPLSARQVE